MSTCIEFVHLFGLLGFELGNKGKTSGSRVISKKGGMTYIAHNQHINCEMVRHKFSHIF